VRRNNSYSVMLVLLILIVLSISVTAEEIKDLKTEDKITITNIVIEKEIKNTTNETKPALIKQPVLLEKPVEIKETAVVKPIAETVAVKETIKEDTTQQQIEKPLTTIIEITSEQLEQVLRVTFTNVLDLQGTFRSGYPFYSDNPVVKPIDRKDVPTLDNEQPSTISKDITVAEAKDTALATIKEKESLITGKAILETDNAFLGKFYSWLSKLASFLKSTGQAAERPAYFLRSTYAIHVAPFDDPTFNEIMVTITCSGEICQFVVPVSQTGVFRVRAYDRSGKLIGEELHEAVLPGVTEQTTYYVYGGSKLLAKWE